MNQMNSRDWIKHQRLDPDIAHVTKAKASDGKPHSTTIQQLQPSLKLLYREWDKLEFKKGVLYRNVQLNEEVQQQLVLPSSHRKQVFI